MARPRNNPPGSEPLSVRAFQSQAEQAGWQAEASHPLAEAPHEVQVAHLGLDVTEEELRATEAMVNSANKAMSLRAEAFSAPVAVDWRANPANYITAIRDQSSCGSCVSFGTLATIEARMNIVCKTPGQQRDYSEAFLFYCGCGACCNTGWNFAPALEFCKNTGVAVESKFPYVTGNPPCPSPRPTPDFKIAGYTVLASTVERKAAIADGGPVVGGLAVYQDFFAYKSGVYKHVTGNLAGYHAVSVVGYSDTQGCWICKNSWGPSWGDSGFFRIAYGQSMDAQFSMYAPQITTCWPPPTTPCEQYLPYLKRVLLAARTNPLLRRCLLYYICGRPPRPLCPAQYLTIISQVRMILARCPQYRVPFCNALM